MMRFNVGGKYLVLKENTDVSYTRKNILFAFDSIECERSTSFSIPYTAENESIMQMAFNEHTNGQAMRVRMPAQMQDGIVTKQGYIYVTEYNYEKREYKAIFVTGELLGLKAIKDAGNIGDIIAPIEQTVWGSPINASASENEWWKCVNYLEQFTGATPFPSVNIGKTITACLNALGVAGTLPQIANKIRVIPAKMDDASRNVTFKSTLHVPQGSFIEEDYDYCNNVTINDGWFETDEIEWNSLMGSVLTNLEEKYFHWEHDVQTCIMKCFKAKMDVQLSFPSNFPSNVTLIKEFAGDNEGSVGNPYYMKFTLNTFLSNYCRAWFRASYHNPSAGFPNIQKYGTLAGKTVTIPAGTKFAFLDMDDLKGLNAWNYNEGYYGEVIWAEHNGVKYYEGGQPSYEYTLSASTAEPVVGGNVALYPHLPNCTLVELLKILANVTGNVLNYTDQSGVIFEPLTDINTWPVIDINGKLIKKETIQRNFSDYAQNNLVFFDSDSFVLSSEKIKVNYTIDSENIEQSKELQKIIYSEAGMTTSADNSTYTPILIRNDGEEQATDKSTICLSGASDKYLGRIYLTKNDAIQELCTESTSIKVYAKMSLHEFDRIAPKTIIYLDGAKYVWTESQWAKNVATLKLSKI